MHELLPLGSKLENNNEQGEYYLTDVPLLARVEGVHCAVVEADEAQMMGVNSRAELAAAEAAMQARLRARALEAGVGMTAPETVFLSYDTRVGSRLPDRAVCLLRARRALCVPAR